MPSPMNRKMYFGFFRKSSRPFSSSAAPTASGWAALAATGAALSRPAADAAAPTFRKLRRVILFSFIRKSSLLVPLGPFFHTSLGTVLLYRTSPPPETMERKSLCKSFAPPTPQL